MRRSLLITAVLLAALLGFAPVVPAGHHYFGDANPIMNRFNRRLGIGWGDGYHAYGSPESWSVSSYGHSHHRPRPTMMWPVMTMPAGAAPVMIRQQPSPIESLPEPTPARPIAW